MMETHVVAAMRGIRRHLTTAIMLMLEKYVVVFFLSQYHPSLIHKCMKILCFNITVNYFKMEGKCREIIAGLNKNHGFYYPYFMLGQALKKL